MFHHVGSACCSEWLTETSVSAHWSDTFIARLQPTSLRVSAFSSENRLRRLEEIILSAAWSSVTAITVYLYSQYDCLEIMRCSWCPCRLCLCSCLLYVPTYTLLNSVSCRWFARRGLVISGFLIYRLYMSLTFEVNICMNSSYVWNHTATQNNVCCVILKIICMSSAVEDVFHLLLNAASRTFCF